MKRNVLYISYTGLLDPLGQSQVLQYVRSLTKHYRMLLLTFEKHERLAESARLAELEAICEAAEIQWHRLTWHNRPGIPATVYDILAGTRKAVALARQEGASVVHTRSYIAGIMGMAVKKATGARFVFDMRGFWPDERVDGGIWKRNSHRYRFFKRVERRLLAEADHVVSLTRAGAREIQRFDYLQDRCPPISVIPTCTNLEVFRPQVARAERPSGFTLGYVGSAGSWYLFRDVARAVRHLFRMRADARFLVINQGDHGAIRRMLEAEGVDLQRVEVRSAPFASVASEVARMDAGIFFIKPTFSKRASCPTRMGEFLGCGKPCLANGAVGDVAEDLLETGTGVAIESFDDETLEAAVTRIIALTAEPDIAARCRRAAEERFALDSGVATYASIYRSLAQHPDGDAT